MKFYDKRQFKKMVKCYHKEFGKKEINDWSDFYESLKKELTEIKKNNKIDEEKLETKAILEYCSQYNDNSNVKFSITVATLIYSIITTVVTMFSQSLPHLFLEKFISIASILSISSLIIAIVTIFSFSACRKMKDDTIYYKIKLELIEIIENT